MNKIHRYSSEVYTVGLAFLSRVLLILTIIYISILYVGVLLLGAVLWTATHSHECTQFCLSPLWFYK